MTMDPVRASFAPVAGHYVRSTSHSDPASLARMCMLVGAQTGRLALDVASGGGHATFALANSGCRVIACDGTPEMMIAAREEGRKRGLAFEGCGGDAHRLPFPADEFDIVTCRIAPHHFADPGRSLREMARVLKPGGRFYLLDLSSPENAAIARWIDAVERLRDPSHVCCWSKAAWDAWAKAAGLRVVKSDRIRRQYDVASWLGRQNVLPAARIEIVERIKAIPPSWHDELMVDLSKDPPVFGTPLLEMVAEK